MNVNADFDSRVVVRTNDLGWLPSPMPGVERKMFDRIGGEVARATSIVRYAPNSSFSHHTHGGGEEFLVLDGVFQDEGGDYPPGTYVRNPPGSGHTPRSETGCTIFVKLRQFDASDLTFIRSQIDLQVAAAKVTRTTVLFELPDEVVSFEKLAGGAELHRPAPLGAELLVLSGSLKESGTELRHLDWLRVPRGSTLRARAGNNGAKVWLKLGGQRDTGFTDSVELAP